MSKNELSKPAGAAASSTEHGEAAVETAEDGRTDAKKISRKECSAQPHDLQVELVELQRHFIHQGDRILVLLEGRDSAGKDGGIKRLVAHLSPRDTRVVALGKSSDGDLRSRYFERYVGQLPKAKEIVLFNRSWYNRGDILSRLPYAGRNKKIPPPDREIVFEFTPECLSDHRLAR